MAYPVELGFIWLDKEGNLIKQPGVGNHYPNMIVYDPFTGLAHKWIDYSQGWEMYPTDSKEVLQLKLLAAIS